LIFIKAFSIVFCVFMRGMIIFLPSLSVKTLIFLSSNQLEMSAETVSAGRAKYERNSTLLLVMDL
jgi:hypothetical protein